MRSLRCWRRFASRSSSIRLTQRQDWSSSKRFPRRGTGAQSLRRAAGRQWRGGPRLQARPLLPLAQNDWAALSRGCVASLAAGGSHFSPGEFMALPARFSLLHSDLNDFLFASVGEEQNGVTLSVVSALTRLGLDPWEEASRLTPLPKPRAAEALAKVIARLPIHRTQLLDD